MTLSEKIVHLKAAFPLARLRLEELAVFAEATGVRVFLPDEVVCAAEQPLKRLLIVVLGAVVDQSGRSIGSVLGIHSLLFNRGAAETFRAARDTGATCLFLRKGHFFTLINECPGLLLSYLSPQPEEASHPKSPSKLP